MFDLHSSQSGRPSARETLWVQLDEKDLSKHLAIKESTRAQCPPGARTEKKTMLEGPLW